jgi:hypothetical protein
LCENWRDDNVITLNDITSFLLSTFPHTLFSKANRNSFKKELNWQHIHWDKRGTHVQGREMSRLPTQRWWAHLLLIQTIDYQPGYRSLLIISLSENLCPAIHHKQKSQCFVIRIDIVKQQGRFFRCSQSQQREGILNKAMLCCPAHIVYNVNYIFQPLDHTFWLILAIFNCSKPSQEWVKTL